MCEKKYTLGCIDFILDLLYQCKKGNKVEGLIRSYEWAESEVEICNKLQGC